MLKYQGMSVVQFVHRDMNHEVFFGERHVLVHLNVTVTVIKNEEERGTDLQGIIKIPNLTQVVKKLVDASLIILNEGVKGHHIYLFRIRRLVCKIL